eukprot:8415291-Pyramimonas_sp.AAC.1
MRKAWQEWDAAHIARGCQSGPAQPDCKKQYKLFVFSFSMACLVADGAKCVAAMGRGARMGRSRADVHAGRGPSHPD